MYFYLKRILHNFFLEQFPDVNITGKVMQLVHLG